VVHAAAESSRIRSTSSIEGGLAYICCPPMAVNFAELQDFESAKIGQHCVSPSDGHRDALPVLILLLAWLLGCAHSTPASFRTRSWGLHLPTASVERGTSGPISCSTADIQSGGKLPRVAASSRGGREGRGDQQPDISKRHRKALPPACRGGGNEEQP
jgi:hypothetical protein